MYSLIHLYKHTLNVHLSDQITCINLLLYPKVIATFGKSPLPSSGMMLLQLSKVFWQICIVQVTFMMFEHSSVIFHYSWCYNSRFNSQLTLHTFVIQIFFLLSSFSVIIYTQTMCLRRWRFLQFIHGEPAVRVVYKCQ